MKVETLRPILEAIKDKVEKDEYLTIYSLSSKSKISHNQLYKILNKGQIPTIKTLEKILDAVGGVYVFSFRKDGEKEL
jgi:predicted transcriptional regulator